MENPKKPPTPIQRDTTDLYLKDLDEEKNAENNQNHDMSQEKSFENFISFQNMQKKQQQKLIPTPSSKDIQMEDSGYIIERNVSSINKDNTKCNMSSFNASGTNQLNVQSYPHTFITYKNYSVLETNDRSASKFSDKKLWLKDKTQVAVQKYRTLAALIERHLSDLKHPLCIIKNEYVQYFVRYNQKLTISKESKPPKPDDLHKELKYMTRDVKSFVWVFKEAINNFYDLESVSKKFRTSEFDLFSDYNLINFIYSVVFTDEVYSIFFETLKLAEKYKEILYKRNIDLLKNSPPEKFLVQEKFCLNKRTAEFFARAQPELKPFIEFPEEKKKPNQKEVKTKKMNYIELQTRIFPHLLMNSFSKSEILNKNAKSERGSRKSNEKKADEPYHESIDLLKNLQFLKSPSHKIKAMTEAFDLIEETIRQHYADHGYDERYIVMEPEDLISIIVYIMSQLPLSHMVTHCNFIELFFNETNLNSKSACYLYSLKTGIEYILNSIDENE